MNPLCALFADADQSNRVRIVEHRNQIAEMAADLPTSAGSRAFLIHPLPITGTTIQRLFALCVLRMRIGAALRLFLRAGVSQVAAYVVLPTVEAPTFVYQLGSPAGAYGHRFLRLDDGGRFRAARKCLEWIAGCDPAAGAVVVVGIVTT